jgi:DNA-binding NarL/FixJ family response regulator
MSPVNVKILLADDHRIVRSGLRSLLEKEAGIEVIAEAANGRDTVRVAGQLSPDVVVMDITMPDLNGIEATRQVVEAAPRTKVIALSMHSDRMFVRGMLAAGASGYLLKDCAFEELVRAVRAVAAGQAYLSPSVVRVLIGDYVRDLQTADSLPTAPLTPREREVLQLLAEGKTSKEVAFCLCVSPKTVDRHRERIMQKLSLHSIAEITKYAIRAGLTSLEA